MPRAWKTPRPRRRRLRRLGIPEPVVRQPRYALTRAIRRVSLTEMNEAQERIGSLEIAHETDLKFLETLESFAVQMAEEDELFLDAAEEVEPVPEADDDRVVQEAAALEPEPELEVEEPAAELSADELEIEPDEDLVEVLDQPDLAAAPPPPDLPPPPPAVATSGFLEDEPPTIVDTGRPRERTPAPPQPPRPIGVVDADAVVAPPPIEAEDEAFLDDDDPDSLDPDTNELLAAVEQTFSELESMGEPREDLGELDEGPDLDTEGLGEIDEGPLQSWDGTSLDEYMTASPGEMGMASWDGDSLEEYMQWNPDAAEDLASWDGTSYEEYLGQRAPTEAPTQDARSSASDVDAWLTDQRLPAATGDPAVDPLGLGDDHVAEQVDDEATAAGIDGDEDTAAAPMEGADPEPVGLASQAGEASPDELAFSLDLEESGELELDLEFAGTPPAPASDTPPFPATAVPSPADEDTRDDVLDSAVEVNSRDELIVQVGAGLDAALSAEPISLVLDVEEGAGAEPSMGPVDDLSNGLAIPRSASLAALTGAEAGTEGATGRGNDRAEDASAGTPSGGTDGDSKDR